MDDVQHWHSVVVVNVPLSRHCGTELEVVPGLVEL
jgi:hypothetical protein